jgi:hypothetical protein
MENNIGLNIIKNLLIRSTLSPLYIYKQKNIKKYPQNCIFILKRNFQELFDTIL